MTRICPAKAASPRPAYAILAALWLAASPRAALATSDGIWGPFVTSGLPGAEEALIACNPIERRIYLFGPRLTASSYGNNNETYVLDMAVTPPRFQRMAAVGPLPAARAGGALVFDPRRHRLLLFGGRSLIASITETEVWELSLGDPPRWRRLEPAGPAPGPRLFHVAVYDPPRDRVIVYGGSRRDEGFYYSLSDTWALALSPELTWSEVTTAGAAPPALAGAAAIYDPRRDRLLVYGGAEGPDLRNPRQDLWRLSLSATPTWSLVHAGGIPPAFRGRFDAAYDSTADRLYVVSSEQEDTGSPERLGVSRLDLGSNGAWESVVATGSDPGRRFEASATILGRELVCIGGRHSDGFQSDAHSLDLDADVWADLEPIGSSPPPRMTYARAALDSLGARVFLLAQSSPTLWTLRLEPTPAWQRPVVEGVAPTVSNMPLVWDASHERLLGVDVLSAPIARVWSLSPDPRPSWTLLEPVGTGPILGWPSIVLDRKRGRLLVLEGRSGSGERSPLWQLRLDTAAAWDTLPGLPAPASGAAIAIDEARDLLVVFGGNLRTSRLGLPEWQTTLWTRSLQSDDAPWVVANQFGAPPSRPGELLHDNRRDRWLYITQGTTDVRALVLSAQPTWTPLQPPDPPADVQVIGPALMDGARDRLLVPLHSYLNGAQLRFAGAGAPGLLCPAAGSWSPGSIREVSFGLVDHAGLGLTYEYVLSCEREWPGFPIRGIAIASPFATEFVPVAIPIPDSAALGTVAFGLALASREQPELETSCSFGLVGGPAPVVALGGDAQPDRIVVRWRTTFPDVELTIARRIENGPWVAVARRALASPGVVSYEDVSIQTDQRYYYRAEVSDPSRFGSYGQIRVDVPQWTLAFASDQPNPIRGRFSVDCSVAAPGRIDLDVFDVSGRNTFSASRVAGAAGRVSFDLDGSDRTSSGVYFLRLRQGAQTRLRRVVLIR